MFRFAVALGCGLLVLPLGRADDALQEALAVQQARRNAIHRAEPAVAAVLVSRSALYRKFQKEAPPADSPGELGDYTPPPAGLADAPDLPERRKQLDLADPAAVPESFGTAVAIDKDGLLLTHYHLVRDATKVFVRLPNGRGSYANIHAADPRSDLAVLRLIDRRVLPLSPVALGDGDRVQKGDWVIGLTNTPAPGFRDTSPTASWGIISNVRRRLPPPSRDEERNATLHHYGTLLQTDARLTAPCTGGALVNLQGELIGLATALATVSGDTPTGYAVPLTGGMRRIVEQLRQGKEVEYGFLGVGPGRPGGRMMPVDGPGIRLERVIDGGPAAAAGLLGGDVLVRINGEPVHESDDLFLLIGTHLAGSTVRLEVQRNFRPLTVNVTLAKFFVPTERIIATVRPPLVRGLRVDHGSVHSQREQGFRMWPGVTVRDVVPGSAADRALLQPGKLIVEVAGKSVTTPTEFYREMQGKKGPVGLTVQSNDGGTRQVTLGE